MRHEIRLVQAQLVQKSQKQFSPGKANFTAFDVHFTMNTYGNASE